MSKEKPKAVAVLVDAAEEEALWQARKAYRCPGVNGMGCGANFPKAYDIDKRAEPSDDHYAPRNVRCRLPGCGRTGKIVPDKHVPVTPCCGLTGT
jgi:hypothetical protein